MRGGGGAGALRTSPLLASSAIGFRDDARERELEEEGEKKGARVFFVLDECSPPSSLPPENVNLT